MKNKSRHLRLNEETWRKLQSLAWCYDCTYHNEPSISQLLMMIADGELVLIQKDIHKHLKG